ncbi:MAG TPA: vitamin K epoxide reductase family protein [Terriglobales bacterium]|nr:vitamin K epoxide reductase family protein [Terriglobales bacterium]
MYAAIAVLAVAGVAVSSVSLYHHFSKSKTSFCNLGQSFDCDLVNRSQYSTFHKVPVALVGVFGYLLVLSLATVYREKAETPFILGAVVLGGLGFALRLTYLEGFVLHAWCVLCLSSLAIISAITVLTVIHACKALKAQ